MPGAPPKQYPAYATVFGDVIAQCMEGNIVQQQNFACCVGRKGSSEDVQPTSLCGDRSRSDCMWEITTESVVRSLLGQLLCFVLECVALEVQPSPQVQLGSVIPKFPSRTTL